FSDDWQNDRQIAYQNVDMTAQKVGQRRRRAAVWHMGDLGTGLVLEKLHRKMKLAPDTWGSISQLRLLGFCDEFRDRLDAELWRGHEQIGGGAENGDRRKISLHVERQVLQQRRIDREVARGNNE